MKKYLAMLLAITMIIGLFIGCAQAPGEESQQSALEQPAQESAQPPAEEATAPEQDSPAEPEAPAQVSYPLTDETVTLSLYTMAPGGPPCVEESWADLKIFQDAETLTNIHIDWVEPASSDQLALVIASGDYPDIINGMSTYANGLGGSYEEEIILELRDMIDQNMPNYSALVSEYGLEKDLVTDEGYELQVCVLYNRAEKADGIFVRSDWLSALDMQVPTTIGQLTDVLEAFKNEYGCTQALYFTGSGMVDSQNWISSAYGFACPNASDASTEHLYVTPDGQIASGLTQPAYKDYLQQLSDWYQAGYISVDFTNDSDESTIQSAVTSGDTGVFAKSCNTLPTYFSAAQDPNFDLIALGALSLEDGAAATNEFYPATQIGRDGLAISTQCEYPELALQWLDYWYSDEGYYALNYGPEGLTWNRDESGEVVYTEVITNDPDYNANTIIMKYNCQGKITGVHNVDSNLMVWTDKQIESLGIFEGSAENTYMLPSGLSLTTDEATEYSVTFADIATYASEYLLRFINGEYDIDQTWQEFQDGIAGMGMADCIAIYQNAYDRYLQR